MLSTADFQCELLLSEGVFGVSKVSETVLTSRLLFMPEAVL